MVANVSLFNNSAPKTQISVSQHQPLWSLINYTTLFPETTNPLRREMAKI